MPKQIVYFTKYSRNGASSRLRSYQYIDKLKQEKEVEITVQTLFSEQYLIKLYQNKSIIKEAFMGYLYRFFFLFKILAFDKVVIEKELFPYLPAFFEWILSRIGVKYIVDYDDAIFHNYDSISNVFIKKMIENKIESVIKLATIVTVGNTYLANYATNAKAKQVIIIPTVIDIDRYIPKTDYRLKKVLNLGWIGTPKTIPFFQGNLNYIISNYEYNFKIITIGGRLDITNVLYEFIDWSESSEVENIKKIDVGTMPLLDTDFEKGKCGYKLIQFMACGIPVIASAVGANNEIVTNGYNGFLVNDPTDWEKHINFFIQNPEQVKKLGEQARQTVLKKYTLQVQYPIIKQLLEI